MKLKIFCLIASSSCLTANIGLSPSIPLFPEEGLFLAKESFATLKAGYYLNWTIQEHQKNKHSINHAELSSFAQYGALSLCLSDLVDLYGFVGMQSNTLKFHRFESSYKFKDHDTFSWALMADGILNTWGKLQLGVTAFYTSCPPHKGNLYQNSSFLQKTTYWSHAWGVGLGFAYDFDHFAPYARLDYIQSKSSLEYFRKKFFHTMHPLGLVFGLVGDFSHGFFGDLEVSFIQSYAIRGMLGVRF